MPKWFTHLSNRCKFGRKKRPPVGPVTIQEQIHGNANTNRNARRNKTLGDICDNSGSFDELDKKAIGLPLLETYRERRVCLTDPAHSTGKLATQINPKSGSAVTAPQSKSLKRRNLLKRWFTSRRKGVQAKNDHGPEVDDPGRTIAPAQRREELTSDQVTRTHTPDSQKIRLHITPGGEARPVVRQVSDICESEKIEDTANPVITCHPPPELHRSSENLNESLIAPKDPERARQKRRLFANLHVVKIAHASRLSNTNRKLDGSRLDKSSCNATQPEANHTELLFIQHSLSTQTDPISNTTQSNTTNKPTIIIQTVPEQRTPPADEINDNALRLTRGINNQAVAKRNLTRTRKTRQKRTTGTKLTKRRRRSPVGKSPNEVQPSATIKGPGGESENVRTRTPSLECDSHRVAWCRRICEDDRRLREYLLRKAECTCSPVDNHMDSGFQHNCNTEAIITSCPNRIPVSHPVVRNNSPVARTQPSNALSRQANAMIEELIDRLAWDMADGILARASYAKSINSRSSPKYTLMLKKLVEYRHGRTTDTVDPNMQFVPYSMGASLQDD